jgi:hypothetical protein
MDPHAKQQALDYIRSVGAAKLLTREELLAAYSLGSGVPETFSPPAAGPKHSTSWNIASILYYLGGAVVVLGIAILIGQNWEQFSTPMRILVTLGSGIAAYVSATLVGRDERFSGVSAALYLVSGLTLPLGLYVWVYEAGWNLADMWTHTLILAALFAVYLSSFLLLRKTVLLVFSIIFGTLLFYSVTDQLVSGSSIDTWDYYLYRTLLSGLSYILLGYYLWKAGRPQLTGTLYSFGVLGFLGAALLLGGWSPSQNVFWELIFPLLVFGTLYASVYLRSKSFLVFGTLFLMAYILKITGEYFTEGLGWPLALVIAGLLMIGVGYMSVSLNKKYLRA